MVKKLMLQIMTEEQFKKLLFIAKLSGDKKVGELMIDLAHSGEKEYAYQIHKTYCPGAELPPAPESLSLDHPCNWSPYGYCYTNELGRNLEQFNPESHVCIWCEKIYAVPNKIDPWEELVKNSTAMDLRFGELHRE